MVPCPRPRVPTQLESGATEKSVASNATSADTLTPAPVTWRTRSIARMRSTKPGPSSEFETPGIRRTTGARPARQDGNGVQEERLDRFEGAQHPRKHNDRHGAEKQAQQCDSHADSLTRQRTWKLAVYRRETIGRGPLSASRNHNGVVTSDRDAGSDWPDPA